MRKYIIIGACLSIILLVIGHGYSINEKRNMTDNPVRKSIKILEQSPDKVVVSVTYTNISDVDIFVLHDEPFLYVTSNAMVIDEVGPSDKRREYILSDYEKVAPGETIERRRDIAPLFQWLSGPHTYELSITGNYQDPVNGRQWEQPRLTTSFSWTKSEGLSDKDGNDRPLFVSLTALIQHPERYHGKVVHITGIANVDFESKGLYSNRDDFNNGVTKNAVWLDTDISGNIKELNHKYVFVEGVFHKDSLGHLQLYAGTIGNISRIEKCGDGEKPC